MNRTTVLTALTTGALAAGLVGATAASAAPDAASHRKLSAQDATYLKANYQVDLAEIGLGHWIEHHLAPGSRADRLAARTVADHQKAAALVHAIAKRHHLRLPTTPNAQQQAAAAEVESAHHTAYQYFTVQVAGHKMSISETRTEIKKGSNSEVTGFAKGYLPVARMHLAMSERDLAHAIH